MSAAQVTPGGFEREADGKKFWDHVVTAELGNQVRRPLLFMAHRRSSTKRNSTSSPAESKPHSPTLCFQKKHVPRGMPGKFVIGFCGHAGARDGRAQGAQPEILSRLSVQELRTT
jgi:hypothetical protein